MTTFHEENAPQPVNLDRLQTLIRETLIQEQKAKGVNSLEMFHACTERRGRLRGYWQTFKQEYRKLENAVKFSLALPLPAYEQIQWAQSVLLLPNLAFMEIDTTGLEATDEIVRFTLLDAADRVIEDCLIKPITGKLNAQVSAINGIKPGQLENALPINDAWGRIQQALRGRYVISYNQAWDIQQLDKESARHGLARVFVLGECLQKRAANYYNGEYHLTLKELCARIGSPLPAFPNQTSLDRARGQRTILQAFAQAITDLRPIPVETSQVSNDEEIFIGDDYDPFLDDLA